MDNRWSNRFMWTAIKNSLALALLALTLPVGADVLDPFEARYHVSRGGVGVGEARFSLSAWGDRGCLAYKGTAKPNAFIGLFVGKVMDQSYFCPGGEVGVRPYHFRHVETDDQEDSYTLDFDWSAGQVTYNENQTFDAPADGVDPFLLHIAARLWLANADDPANAGERDFSIVDEDEIKTYRLAVSEGETVETPAGTFDTLRVERVDDPDERLILWATPALDYLPIKVAHHDDDDPVVRMELEQISREAASPTE